MLVRVPRLGPQRIAFVCGADFRGPSEKIVLGFASELVDRGHQVLIAIRGEHTSLETEMTEGCPDGLLVVSYDFFGTRLRAGDRDRLHDFAPTLVHMYNPRLPVVSAVQQAFGDTRPIVVNFEDDEWGLMNLDSASRWRKFAGGAGRLLSSVWPTAWPYATPATLAWSREVGSAFHAITPALAEEVERKLDRPTEVVYPVHPALRAIPDNPEPPAELTGLEGRPVVAFTGAVFGPQEEDFKVLLQAIEIARPRTDFAFVFAGTVARRFDLDQWASDVGLDERTFLNLGYLAPTALWGLLKSSNVLVQPGRHTHFNRLRLPSKLLSYLASGSPTITYGFGFGELLEDRVEVLKVLGDEPDELAACLVELLEDRVLAMKLSQNGPVAASRLFDTSRNTDALESVYASALDRHER